MNHDDDARIDAALEALARPQPPADHVARVLARTSASTDAPADRAALAYLRPRWVLPVAATLFAMLGATWQIDRQARSALNTAVLHDGSPHAAGQPAWGLPEEIIRPVLPPQAYWGMDPFHEFATLRPGTRVTSDDPTPVESPKQGTSSSGRTTLAGGRPLTAQAAAADDELTWQPMATGLPPIELVSITPAPLAAPAAVPLEDITLAEIALVPIAIAPLDDQEKP